MTKLLITAIRWYQRRISPKLPPGVCGMRPTCSQYGLEAVQRYGAWKGLRLISERLRRCGIDGRAAKQRRTVAHDPVR